MRTVPAPCDDPEELEHFLSRFWLTEAKRQVLAGDASGRHYQRLIADEILPLILMQSPQPEADIAPFITVAGLLEELGLSAPILVGHDLEAGLMLLEDFGDGTFSRLMESGADPVRLYELATDLLIALHRDFDPARARAAGLPVFDVARFLEQVRLFAEVWLPLVRGGAVEPGVVEELDSAWRAVLPAAERVPSSLLLRDYHVDNLMLLPARQGVAACGLLDFQDAGLGPVAYDLVSLLEDARRELPPGLGPRLTARYLDAFPALDAGTFAAACDVLAAQRHTRVIAVFARLALERGKRRYLGYLPRVWKLLEARLHSPVLAPVAAWFARHLPSEHRADFAFPGRKA